MAPRSRGRSASSSSGTSNVDLHAFQQPTMTTSEQVTPIPLNGLNPPSSSTSKDGDVDEDEDEDKDGDADFQSHYSIDANSLSESSESASDHGDELGEQRPSLHRSNSSFLIANAFAPPFYNRPPTPLPPSPSLTSILRPSFSTNTSRPTTPDSSENDTPNDTEATVAKSARTATTVPRASPKVPTYEYYGFVLYLLSSVVFRM